jgi:hypothetical protein
MKPDPRNFEDWRDWARAHSLWVDQEIEEQLQLRLTTENVHFIGQPGEPAFLNGWANYLPGTPELGFFKDPLGYVHIIGSVFNPNPAAVPFSNVCQLPADYAPQDCGPLGTSSSYEVWYYDNVAPYLPLLGGAWEVLSTGMLRRNTLYAAVANQEGPISLTGFVYKSTPPLVR